MSAITDPMAAERQLARATRAFERGDYARARRLAAELAAPTTGRAAGSESPGSGDTARAARELLTRLAPDGHAVMIGAICAFLITAIFIYYTMA